MFIDSLLGVFLECRTVALPVRVGRRRLPSDAHLPQREKGGSFAKGFLKPLVALIARFVAAYDMTEFVSELKGILAPELITGVEIDEVLPF